MILVRFLDLKFLHELAARQRPVNHIRSSFVNQRIATPWPPPVVARLRNSLI
jgi:hypothetical protein